MIKVYSTTRVTGQKFPQESETALKAGSQIAEATDMIKNLEETPSAMKVRFDNNSFRLLST